MNGRGTGARVGRVLLVVVLTVVGLAYAQAAFVALRDSGRSAAPLAFAQCMLAVFAWAAAVVGWKWTGPRRRVAPDSPAPARETPLDRRAGETPPGS